MGKTPRQKPKDGKGADLPRRIRLERSQQRVTAGKFDLTLALEVEPVREHAQTQNEAQEDQADPPGVTP